MTTGEWSETQDGFEDGGRGHKPRRPGSPWRLEKPGSGLSSRNTALLTCLFLVPLISFQTFDFQTVKIIHFCCYKLPSYGFSRKLIYQYLSFHHLYWDLIPLPFLFPLHQNLPVLLAPSFQVSMKDIFVNFLLKVLILYLSFSFSIIFIKE